jgi:hypothetical protein
VEACVPPVVLQIALLKALLSLGHKMSTALGNDINHGESLPVRSWSRKHRASCKRATDTSQFSKQLVRISLQHGLVATPVPCATVEKIYRIVLQALTGVAGLALAFRYITKTWIRWMLPRVSSPERVWGLEDILYGSAYAFDIAHMVFIQRRWAF